MSTRYERMLEAISKGEKITDEPICRREMFLKALANNEGVSNLPEPICREEEFYKSIIKGEKITVEPICKKEEYLKAIANNEPLPESSGSSCAEEKMFRRVCTSGNVGGGGGSTPTEPTTYTVTFGAGVKVLNGSTSITSGTKVTSGTALKVSYTLSDHYHLVSFKANDTEIVNNTTITVKTNVTITFTQEIDTYSVTFNNGVSVLNGSTSLTSGDKVPYGTSLIVGYTLTDGYKLTSFQVNGVDTENNATITVTGNVDIVFAEEEDASSGGGDEPSSTFSTLSWSEISSISNQIVANKMTEEEIETAYGLKIGDTKSFALTTGENVEVRIIDFNHDKNSNGVKTGITVQMTHSLKTLYKYAAAQSSKKYWSISSLKSSLSTILSTIPTEVRSVIKAVNKVSSKAYGSTSVETIVETIFLLSEIEVYGTYVQAQNGDKEGTQYKYWQDKTEKSDHIMLYDADNDGTPETAMAWWLRSTSTKSNTSACAVWNSGGLTYTSYSGDHGIAFAFCI